MDRTDLNHAARAAADHGALETAARVGYAVNGVMHLLIAWIAVQLAWGSSMSNADQSGAFGALAANPLGRALLWVFVAGFLGLALWQLTEAAAPVRDTAARVKSLAKAVVYAVLTWSSFGFARGGSSSSGEQTSDATASLMAQPFGAAVVALVGLGVLGVGVYHVVKGWRRTFLRDLDGHPGTFVVRAGRWGYVAKGVALALVGVLFGVAAVRNDPAEASGLDGALRTLLDAPFGQVLLTLIGLGVAAYGIYCFARARHAAR